MVFEWIHHRTKSRLLGACYHPEAVFHYSALSPCFFHQCSQESATRPFSHPYSPVDTGKVVAQNTWHLPTDPPDIRMSGRHWALDGAIPVPHGARQHPTARTSPLLCLSCSFRVCSVAARAFSHTAQRSRKGRQRKVGEPILTTAFHLLRLRIRDDRAVQQRNQRPGGETYDFRLICSSATGPCTFSNSSVIVWSSVSGLGSGRNVRDASFFRPLHARKVTLHESRPVWSSSARCRIAIAPQSQAFSCRTQKHLAVSADRGCAHAEEGRRA